MVSGLYKTLIFQVICIFVAIFIAINDVILTLWRRYGSKKTLSRCRAPVAIVIWNCLHNFARTDFWHSFIYIIFICTDFHRIKNVHLFFNNSISFITIDFLSYQCVFRWDAYVHFPILIIVLVKRIYEFFARFDDFCKMHINERLKVNLCYCVDSFWKWM